MDLFRSKLKKFLERKKKCISHGQITMALGNESCDLDSFISSLIVAYAEDAIHVVNMRKEVFVSKGDLMWVCNTYGIDVEDLVFLERPIGKYSLKARRIGTMLVCGENEYTIHEKSINLLLTDHSRAMEELKGCEVLLIIDHHTLSKELSAAERIYIDANVGSATTLVSKYLGVNLSKKNHCSTNAGYLENKEENNTKEVVCSVLARMMLIPIVVDTHHLTRRTSDFDRQEYKKLKKIGNISSKELEKIRNILKKERKNDKHDKTELILQKDMKIYVHDDYTFGASTVQYSYEKWADREAEAIKGFDKDELGLALEVQIEKFRKKMGMDFFIVNKKSKKSRQLIIHNFPYIKKLALENDFKSADYKGLQFYSVSTHMSRKVFIPKIIRMLDKAKLQDKNDV